MDDNRQNRRMWTRRSAAFIIGLVIVGLGSGAIGTSALPGYSYTVSQVLAGLNHQPTVWLDHPIQVRGTLFICPPTWRCPPLFDSLADEQSPTRSLLLEDVLENPALRVVRQVPLLNMLVPPYPPRAIGRRGTYTVTIYRLYAPSCPRKGIIVMGHPYCVVLSDTLGF